MLSINYPKIENKSYLNLELSLIEPMHKLNLRGKNREFFTKVGKQLSIMPVSYTHLRAHETV